MAVSASFLPANSQFSLNSPSSAPSFNSAAARGGNPYMNFLQSNGGSSLISAGLNGLGAVAQAKSQERMTKQQQQLQQQQLLAQAMQGNQQDAFQRDALLAQQAPTGWAQNYEQQTLLKNMMLQKLMSGQVGLTPTNSAVAEKLKALGGGFKPTIPDEWKNVNPFGVDQTMQSLAQRQGTLDLLSGGRGPGLDFTAMGIDPQKAAQLNQSTGGYRDYTNQQYLQPQQQLQEALGLNRLGTNQQQPSQPGRGGQIAKGLAQQGIGMAAPAIAGAMGIGGGAGAAGAAGTAAGIGGSLALGAATMGIGAAVPAAIALYNHLKTGARVNDARDNFKAQYGDAQGSGLQNLVDNYNGPQRDQLMNSYNQFMTAGKPQNLQSAITGLSGILAPPQQQQLQRQLQNPYTSGGFAPTYDPRMAGSRPQFG